MLKQLLDELLPRNQLIHLTGRSLEPIINIFTANINSIKTRLNISDNRLEKLIPLDILGIHFAPFMRFLHEFSGELSLYTNNTLLGKYTEKIPDIPSSISQPLPPTPRLLPPVTPQPSPPTPQPVTKTLAQFLTDNNLESYLTILTQAELNSVEDLAICDEALLTEIGIKPFPARKMLRAVKNLNLQ